MYRLLGIIPAYAGSTRPAGGSYRRGADHPRIRGEHDGVYIVLSDTTGSSPHTRGARPLRKGPPAGNGIIPAYAGSTSSCHPYTCAPADHPRIRGEHDNCGGAPTSERGSSPHTRGAPAACRAVRRALRIIPAYAGSTGRQMFSEATCGDHPRIRGEHYWRHNGRVFRTGSSPHTRGAPHGQGDMVGLVGIIPAYAGSTLKTPNNRFAGRDHPRIRGEHGRDLRADGSGPGSSPHTRGARRPRRRRRD